MPMKIISREEVEKWEVPEIGAEYRHVSEIFHPVISAWSGDKESLLGYPTTSWKIFNQAFGGARPGELITLTGDTGTGKTTWAFNWGLDTVFQKRRAVFISLEIRWDHLVTKLASMIVRKNFDKFEKEDVAGLPGILEDMPLWILDAEGQQDEDFLLKSIRFAGEKKGIKFMILDNLGYVLKKREFGQNDSEVIEGFMKRLSKAVYDSGATVILIAHPAKRNIKGRENEDNREINMDELKGSSSIKQYSDSVLSLFHTEKQETIVRLCKIRNDNFGNNSGVYVRFHYDHERLEHIETSTLIQRGKP